MKRPSETLSQNTLHDYRNISEPAKRWPGANLFRNPFGELTRPERVELAVVDIESILTFVGSESPKEHRTFNRFHAYQLIGRCGRGKTTRMLTIGHHCPKSSYVYLAEDQPCPVIPEGEPLLIDEAQRLPRHVRRRVFRTGVPLVLATHRDLTRTLRRHGYQVRTETIGRKLSPDTLSTILNKRILASRRDPHTAVPTIDRRAAAKLIRIFGTDVRAIEGYLYETVQSQVNQDGEMRFID